ncbi:hypothetical protein RD792_002956 [Penstemon davidsonii]|uniref:Receptor ligand binding region domain-containing protein n=1 Tax=Penstemon davidsonii TaxID=160366 RepID=A0ABR0DSG3_9LAMI|nr:hypothetical protein RD792_002956 [Penstemon davidsonii]
MKHGYFKKFHYAESDSLRTRTRVRLGSDTRRTRHVASSRKYGIRLGGDTVKDPDSVKDSAGLGQGLGQGHALDLLENVEVQAIIIPEISNKELYLAMLGDIAHVPVLSFSSISSSSEHPYFIQVAEDETTQFHGIAALLDAFKWRSFVFLYEDTANARQIQPYIFNILQENHLGVSYQAAISLTSTDDQIINELHKLMTMKASIILVHLSPSLASQVFRNAKLLGMMNKGFAWIATSKTMDFLDSQGSSVYESMQGVLGFKSYIPSSTDAVDRVGTKLPQNQIEDAKLKKLDLARLRVSSCGPSILSEITSSNFTGLGGKIQLNSRKLARGTYEILNVIGNGEIRAGYWTSAYGLTSGISNSSSNILEAIIWPGITLMAPESRLIQMSGKILKVGIPEKSRFPELVSFHYDQESNSSTADGFCIDVFKAAMGLLPYKVPFEYVPFDNEYGSYTDLVKEVYLQAFQKGSPIVHDMSRAIVELREKGRLQELENKWFTNRSPLLSPDSEGSEPSQFNTLNLDSFLGLFLLSGISKAIAIIVFFFYLIRKKLSMSYFISKMLDREFLIFILRNYFPRRVIR